MAKRKMNLIDKFIRLSFKAQIWGLIIISWSVIAIMTLFYLNLTHHQGKAFFAFYQTSIRGYLFSGFISVGSLLLSLHTFVIVNLKDKLFTTVRYKEKFLTSKNLALDAKIDEMELLKPLDTLSSFINISVWLSILTAVAQFTVGLADYGILSVVCIWLALLTICFLMNSLILIREHIKNMLHQKN
ncbi:hypothetical protein [Citrobacter sp. Ce129]|uniref:hypothetical protein n=1 Tax=Citrobacter sp. Ce129 TaxID=2985043 RepID=UPI00257514E5|nr:hypothetical protein [Citrobacter sp. Ce129]MDM3270918.1 hypothetical protein [Citrobacter sp. Ce129]